MIARKISEENQKVADLEVRNPNLEGLALRDLRLPLDTIILSIRRRGQMLISHGYTRLEVGDWVTLVGTKNRMNVAVDTPRVHMKNSGKYGENFIAFCNPG